MFSKITREQFIEMVATTDKNYRVMDLDFCDVTDVPVSILLDQLVERYSENQILMDFNIESFESYGFEKTRFYTISEALDISELRTGQRDFEYLCHNFADVKLIYELLLKYNRVLAMFLNK